ncbi:MAG: type II toxin-antitoxin system CcdA family antitoxin [Betaproteobacteria bacterium]|nr:type II toxin-antitoxin system CcdA family antitoxin [Betaproteobacteria bacterium]
MNARSPAAAVKRPANVSIRSDLLDKARQHEINLSRTLEERLVELIRQKERAAWLERNRAAIEAYNERVDREGVFSDGLRTF